jgi:hypothetical protein
MSGDWKESVARRPLLAALGALAGIGVAGGTVYEVSGLLGGGTPQGPYGDLLAGLGDRNDAAMVGRAVLADAPSFQAHKAAESLRRAIGQKPLAEVLLREAVQGRIVETQGWVLPQTLTLLCALAAKAS